MAQFLTRSSNSKAKMQSKPSLTKLAIIALVIGGVVTGGWIMYNNHRKNSDLIIKTKEINSAQDMLRFSDEVDRLNSSIQEMPVPEIPAE